jgi:hypothetical protein
MLLRICAVSDAAFGGVCGAEFGARFGAEDGAGFGAEFNAGFGAEFSVSYGAGFGATSEQSSVPDSKQSSVCAEFGAGFGVGVDAASVQSWTLRCRVDAGFRAEFGVGYGAEFGTASAWRSELRPAVSLLGFCTQSGTEAPWATRPAASLLGCFDPSAASLLGLCGGNFAASTLRRLPSLGFAAATLLLRSSPRLLRSFGGFPPWALQRQLCCFDHTTTSLLGLCGGNFLGL